MPRATPWGPGHAWPDYGDGGLLALARALRGFVQEEGTDGPLPLEDAEKVIVLLLDGMGAWQFEVARREGKVPHLGELEGRDLSSVLPSTTASALVTLSTGLPPARHGYLGYRLRLGDPPVLGDTLRTQVLGTETPLRDVGLGLEDLASGPTLLAQAVDRGIGAYALTREEFLSGDFTQVLYGGGTVLGYRSDADLLRQLRVLARREGRALIYAYWDTLDEAGHLHGATSPAFLGALEGFDALLGESLEAFRAASTLLAVTADHGHLDCPPERAVEVTADPVLSGLLAHPPMGEGRLPYLHVRPGGLPRLLDHLEAELAEAVDWILAQEAWDAGLFGPDPDPWYRPRVGDLVLLPRRGWHVTDARLPGPRGFVGRHGGTSPEEMRIPLLWAAP